MGEEEDVIASVTETMQIDPEKYSPVTNTTNPNPSSRIITGLAGVLYMLRWEKALYRHLIGGGIGLILAVWLEVGLTRFLLLFQMVLLLVVIEFVNTAVEAAVNVATTEIHPMAKVAKDVAASAVLVASVGALIVAAFILIPPLIDRLGM